MGFDFSEFFQTSSTILFHLLLIICFVLLEPWGKIQKIQKYEGKIFLNYPLIHSVKSNREAFSAFLFGGSLCIFVCLFINILQNYHIFICIFPLVYFNYGQFF